VTTSAPPGEQRPVRVPRVPLRITLVALLVALVALAMAVTGFAATSLLRGYLTQQQDDQLRAQVQDIQADEWGVLRACLAGHSGPAPSTYVACLPPEGEPLVVLGPQDRDDAPDLSGIDRDAAPQSGHPADGQFTTVPAVDGHLSWRVATITLPEGYTGVVATDVGPDEKAIGRLVRIEIVVGLMVLSVLGVAGYLLVRNSLRPLTEVELTARAIAAGDLSRRVPEGDDRTEVGRLSTAINGMLSRIERAFRAQQDSEAQARGSEERMRRFVADASHELRTPLTSIRGFAELYRQGAAGEPDDVRRVMQRIEAEGARMGVLVEDMLLLARLDQQRPLTVAPVDLAAVAGDVVHDARVVSPDRPVALHLDESLTDVPVVLGDEGRLRQVVGNLVGNALTHTPPGTRVTVTLAEEADAPGMVVLRVSDTGPGMAPEDAERVFERFYRADASRNRTAGGTGLGLAIVASLVAAHGGSVDLATAPGKGATFIVRLPRSGPPPAAAAPGLPEEPAGPAETIQG
jgi:signal transduction histidine kinase